MNAMSFFRGPLPPSHILKTFRVDVQQKVTLRRTPITFTLPIGEHPMTQGQTGPTGRGRGGRTARVVPELAWRAQSLPAMRGWQRRLRARLRTITGLPETPRGPVRAEVLEERDFGTYRRETIQFECREGLDAFGYFLIPADAPLNSPAVLCLPGHGRGVECILGIMEDGSQRPPGTSDDYARDFALQCVAHGYPTFALEQISFGRRRDALAVRTGQGSSCTRDSMAALMLGETMAGWRVADAQRTLDYLAGRREVNGRRLAVMGISGGGLTALWTAGLDTRVRAAVVSAYFNTFQASILAMDHCVDNYVPGLSRTVEMPDLAGLVAPRPLFVESGSRDPIFPLAGFEAAVARAREIYAAFGRPEAFDAEVFDGEHHFHGVGAFHFLKAHL